MKEKTKGFGLGAKATRHKQKGIPRLMARPEADLKRHVSPPLALQLKANTSGAVPYRRGPLANTPATVNVRTESPAAATSGDPGTNGLKNAPLAEIKFPLCDAAVRKIDSGDWDLADAIVAECCETGDDGVRNESYAKMEAMRQEIAANHGLDLSFERIRKLRKVASAFPPGRRRPAVSLDGHLEAGSPDVLDELINSAPNGTTLTRDYIRGRKHPAAKAEHDQHKVERRQQTADQRRALQNICRQLERATEEREQQYTALCRSVGKEPEPFSPPLSPENEPPLSVAEDLERALRVLLTVRGFDPKTDNIRRAIEEFVRAVLAEQQ
ncbi:MAG: hypothetical protein WB677_22855 [Xanthobacteraceae bacterium]